MVLVNRVEIFQDSLRFSEVSGQMFHFSAGFLRILTLSAGTFGIFVWDSVICLFLFLHNFSKISGIQKGSIF